MLNLDPQYSFLAIAGALAIAYFVVKKFYQFDTKVEQRRRVAYKVSNSLASKGLKFLPPILEDYAVGDYSGMAIKFEKIANVLTHDPEAVEKEFEVVFARILAAKLADPTQKAALVALVTAVAVPVKAPVA